MRERLDTARVVAAASQLADRHGFDRLTLGELAQALGIRTPSLYSHIDGLDHLRRELQHTAAVGLCKAFTEAAVGRSGDDAVRAIAHAYRRFAREHPGLYAATTVATEPDDLEGQRLAREAADVVIRAVAGYGLDEDAAIHFTRALRASLHGWALLEGAGAFGLPNDVDQSFERLIDLLVVGLRGTQGKR